MMRFAIHADLYDYAAENRLDQLKFLLPKIGDRWAWNDSFGYTALHHAVNRGAKDTATFLIDLYLTKYHIMAIDSLMSASLTDKEGNTALHAACMANNLDIVKLFTRDSRTAQFFGITQANKKGDTPLHVAVRHGHVSVVRELIGSGTDFDFSLRNKAGKRALDLANLGSTPAYLELSDMLSKLTAQYESRVDQKARGDLIRIAELEKLDSVESPVEAVEALLEYCISDKAADEAKRAAEAALCAIGEKTKPNPLHPLFIKHSSASFVWEEKMKVLCNVFIKLKDREATKLIAEAMKQPYLGSKEDIYIEAIGKIGGDFAVDYLLEQFDSSRVEWFRRGLYIEALKAVNDKKVIPPLLEYVQKNQHLYRKGVPEVIDLLVFYGLDKTELKLPYLYAQLDRDRDRDSGESHDDRQLSVMNTAKELMGLGSRDSIDYIIRIAINTFGINRQDMQDVQKDALLLLEKFGDKKAIEPLKEYFEKYSSNKLREIIADVLASLGMSRKAIEELEALTGMREKLTGIWSYREEGIESVKKLKTDNPGLFEKIKQDEALRQYLVQQLGGNSRYNSHEQLDAIKLLVVFGDERDIPLLRRVVSISSTRWCMLFSCCGGTAENKEVRKAAKAAIKEIQANSTLAEQPVALKEAKL